MKNLFVALFLSFHEIQGGGSGRLLVDESIYKNNDRRCNPVFLALLTGQAKPSAKTQDAKEICENLESSCCSKQDIDLMINKMKPAQEEIKKQMKFLSSFLEFSNSLNTEELIKNIPAEVWAEVETETAEEKQPALDPKTKKPFPDQKQQEIRNQRKEKKRKDFEKTIREMQTQNNEIQTNLNTYFNDVVRNYSGMICSVCDPRFSHFLSTDKKILISREQCSDYLANQTRLLSLALDIGTLVAIANKLEVKSEERFTYQNFKKKLKDIQAEMGPCFENESDEMDLTDSQIDKLNESKLVDDDGVSDDLKYLNRCGNICKSSLATAPFQLGFNLVDTMEYIMKVLKPLSSKPELANVPLPSKEPIYFFESVARYEETEIGFQETSLYFSGFPVEAKLYQVVEVKPIVYEKPKQDDVIPKIPLTFWQKLFNVLFGWLFGKYEEKIGVQ